MTTNELYHWGIKGMKWGIRRYQNEDGTLTEAGKKRYYENNNILTQRNTDARTMAYLDRYSRERYKGAPYRLPVQGYKAYNQEYL